MPAGAAPKFSASGALAAVRGFASSAAAPAAVAVSVVLLYFVVNYLHFRFLDVNVVLYAAMFDAALASAIVAIAVWRPVAKWLAPREAVLAVLLGFSASVFFALALPTVIDRSLSIYILEKLAQRGGGIREDAFARVFTEEYLPEHHLVEIRLTEQLQSGTIRIDNGCVRLTPRGWMVTEISRAYRQNLLPKRRLLMGAFTDTLTDPFRNSKPVTDYVC